MSKAAARSTSEPADDRTGQCDAFTLHTRREKAAVSIGSQRGSSMERKPARLKRTLRPSQQAWAKLEDRSALSPLAQNESLQSARRARSTEGAAGAITEAEPLFWVAESVSEVLLRQRRAQSACRTLCCADASFRRRTLRCLSRRWRQPQRTCTKLSDGPPLRKSCRERRRIASRQFRADGRAAASEGHSDVWTGRTRSEPARRPSIDRKAVRGAKWSEFEREPRRSVDDRAQPMTSNYDAVSSLRRGSVCTGDDTSAKTRSDR